MPKLKNNCVARAKQLFLQYRKQIKIPTRQGIFFTGIALEMEIDRPFA
jgi:hypothetical protein